VPDLRPEFPPTHLSDASAGINGDEESDINLLRDTWIRHQLRTREAEFSTKHNILFVSGNVIPSCNHADWTFHTSIRIGTFNVQSKPPEGSLLDWMSNGNGQVDPADMLVFGFQELDTSAEGLLYSSTTVKEDLWYQAILRDMGELSLSYHKVRAQSQGIDTHSI
jgi:inositol polyphosphate 5-phosphatase INPP5B/F